MAKRHGWALVGAMAAALPGAAQAAPALKDQINQAQWRAGQAGVPQITRTQVLLDRAFFSPGIIDGITGSNMKKALQVYQEAHDLPKTGAVDRRTWQSLSRDRQPVLTTYSLTKEDVAGPFVRAIPADMKKMAKLARLAYTSPQEAVAEKFHMSPSLLKRLNPGADFKKIGTRVVVANVAGRKPRAQVARIMVDKKLQAVRALDRDNRLVAFYPATVGSAEFPSPSGSLKVTGVAERPVFTYSSRLEYSKLKEGQVLKIPAGPNNPVGIVWIDLNKRGYGIHGTPEPARISKAQSHGCIRLTNWDAQELARMVKPGVPVAFSGVPRSAVAGTRQEQK